MKVMTDDQKEKIKELIKRAERIGIFLGKNPKEHYFLTAIALKKSLEENNKIVTLTPPPDQNFIKRWNSIAVFEKDHINPALSICIPKNQYEVKEISYEENEKYYILNIISNEKPILPKDILFERKQSHLDVLFSFDKIDKRYFSSVLLPSPEKTIYIDTLHGSLTEKFYEIIKSINEKPISREIASLLYASLILERIKEKKLDQEKFKNLEQTLVYFGIDTEVIKKIVLNLLSVESLPIT